VLRARGRSSDPGCWMLAGRCTSCWPPTWLYDERHGEALLPVASLSPVSSPALLGPFLAIPGLVRLRTSFFCSRSRELLTV